MSEAAAKEEEEKPLTEKMDELIQLMTELKAAQGGWWVPAKPKQTIYNVGKFIVDKTLAPGKWNQIFAIKEKNAPFIVYWKILVTSSPNVKCLCFQDECPVCENGCDMSALHTLGVTSYNARGWVHIWDEINDIYGMQCNIIRPVCGSYKFAIQNAGDTPATLRVLYFKWYQWNKDFTVEVF